MFFIPAIAAFGEKAAFKGDPAVNGRRSEALLLWFSVWLGLTIFIGFRYEVGGDWFNYFHFLRDVQGLEFRDVMSKPDPSYQLLNWVSDGLGWNIFGVNVVGAGLFAFGLLEFCRNQPRPWLALTAAIPYLVIVVAMGYTRQGIALGIIMIGLVALQEGSPLKFIFLVGIAATFHKSAVLLIPVAALANSRNRYLTMFLAVVTVIVLYVLLISNEADALYTNYIVKQYQSEGALVRLSMNAIAAGILLMFRFRLGFTRQQYHLWVWFSIISLALLGAYAFTPASTALDRVALYLLPLQIVISSRAPSLFVRHGGEKEMDGAIIRRNLSGEAHQHFLSNQGNVVVLVLIVLYWGIVQFTWLNFANNAFYWVPYKLYL
ncbi:MAG TPA: EpsG family protein [Methylobacter sp.]